jgi:hypothetical protein
LDLVYTDVNDVTSLFGLTALRITCMQAR